MVCPVILSCWVALQFIWQGYLEGQTEIEIEQNLTNSYFSLLPPLGLGQILAELVLQCWENLEMISSNHLKIIFCRFLRARWFHRCGFAILSAQFKDKIRVCRHRTRQQQHIKHGLCTHSINIYCILFCWDSWCNTKPLFLCGYRTWLSGFFFVQSFSQPIFSPFCWQQVEHCRATHKADI